MKLLLVLYLLSIFNINRAVIPLLNEIKIFFDTGSNVTVATYGFIIGKREIIVNENELRSTYIEPDSEVDRRFYFESSKGREYIESGKVDETIKIHGETYLKITSESDFPTERIVTPWDENEDGEIKVGTYAMTRTRLCQIKEVSEDVIFINNLHQLEKGMSVVATFQREPEKLISKLMAISPSKQDVGKVKFVKTTKQTLKKYSTKVINYSFNKNN